MTTITKRLYEGLFLVDTALANSDWDAVAGEIKGIIEKRGGEVVSLKKWDERRLAYEIQKKNRGTYIIVYFNCVTSGITQIERDINLSENIVRAMIIRGENVTEEDMTKETPLEAQVREEAEKTEGEAGEESAAVEDETQDEEIEE